MARADVTVMGAGVMGLCVAWALVQQGARVRVIDPGGPGAGASGGLVGALAPHVPEQWNAKKAFQLDALLMAPAFWAGVAAAGGGDAGFARLGRLQPVADASGLALARARAAGAETLWRGQAVWEVIPAGADWAPVSPSGWLIRDTLSARISPRRALAALVAALRATGTEVVTGEASGGAPEGAVVWATGHAGLRELLGPGAALTAAGEKGQAAALALARPDCAQMFADGVLVVPQADGTVAVGSTSERDWAHPGPDAALDALIARARALVPALAGAPVVARWAGIRPRWKTRAPLVGARPGRPGHYIANGGYKIGFAVAPLAGQLLADLILTGTDAIAADFRPVAGA